MNASQSPRRRFLPALAVGIVMMLAGYITSQLWLSEPGNQQRLVDGIAAMREALCDSGVRFPGDHCQFVSPVVEQPESGSVTEIAARFPDLITAQNYFTWQGGGESEAARYLALMTSLTAGRHHQSGSYQAFDTLAARLQPIWQRYPELVAGAACTFCSRHYRLVANLIASNGDNVGASVINMAIDPVFFRVLLTQGALSEQEIATLLPLHAQLSWAGDADTASTIGQALAVRQQWSDLLQWVRKGLNGGRALGKLPLAELPRELVIEAWQQGVAKGSASVDLTEFLVASGHRPALRWLIWLEGTDFPYLHEYSYKYAKQRYKWILQNHTYFPVLSGDELVDFYNKHWKSIRWNPDRKRWDW